MVWKREVMRSGNGEVMIESMLVMIITIFMLLFIIAMFSFMFFRWNIQTTANDIAARYAQSYSYLAYGSDVSIDSGAPSSVSSISIDPYRYFTAFKSRTPNVDEAKAYAAERLKKSSTGFAIGSSDVDINVTNDFIGRRHVEVVISGSYAVLFQDFFKGFNMDKVFQYKVYGYADCVDLLDYLNTVQYVNWLSEGASLKIKSTGVIDNIIKVIAWFFK